jgi:hypothetical protein
VTARLWNVPAAAAVTAETVFGNLTPSGTELLFSVPSPSVPLMFCPQANRPPSVTASVWYRPAATL